MPSLKDKRKLCVEYIGDLEHDEKQRVLNVVIGLLGADSVNVHGGGTSLNIDKVNGVTVSAIYDLVTKLRNDE